MTPHDEVKGEGFEMVDHEEPEKPAEGAEPGAEKAVPLDVYTVLRVSIAQLEAVAWQMMGLRPDPFTAHVHKDIAQARVAIDAAAAMIGQLKPHIQPAESREYDTMLTNLRLNFVSHSAEGEKT